MNLSLKIFPLFCTLLLMWNTFLPVTHNWQT